MWQQLTPAVPWASPSNSLTSHQRHLAQHTSSPAGTSYGQDFNALYHQQQQQRQASLHEQQQQRFGHHRRQLMEEVPALRSLSSPAVGIDSGSRSASPVICSHPSLVALPVAVAAASASEITQNQNILVSTGHRGWDSAYSGDRCKTSSTHSMQGPMKQPRQQHQEDAEAGHGSGSSRNARGVSRFAVEHHHQHHQVGVFELQLLPSARMNAALSSCSIFACDVPWEPVMTPPAVADWKDWTYIWQV